MSWSKPKALELIRETRLVPVVRTTSMQAALYAVEGTVAAGVSIVEITMTVPNALRVIESVSKCYGDKILLGAGTILNTESCRDAIQAGADFIVSPVLDVDVVELAHRHGKLCFPGALTPNEVFRAWQAGGDLVKVFHCGLMGGAQYIRALKGPFPDIELIPTGGLNFQTAPECIKAGAVAVGVGPTILDPEALRLGKVDVITANTRKFLEAIGSGRTSSPTS